MLTANKLRETHLSKGPGHGSSLLLRICVPFPLGPLLLSFRLLVGVVSVEATWRC